MWHCGRYTARTSISEVKQILGGSHYSMIWLTCCSPGTGNFCHGAHTDAPRGATIRWHVQAHHAGRHADRDDAVLRRHHRPGLSRLSSQQSSYRISDRS